MFYIYYVMQIYVYVGSYHYEGNLLKILIEFYFHRLYI